MGTDNGNAPEERKEAPDDNKIGNTSSYSRLVQVRLGKRERSILLGINGEEWTPFAEWKCGQSKNKATISRAINKLIRSQLIESDYDYAEGMRSSMRRDKNGMEQNYNIYYDRTRMLKLTPLGAAVVEQFRDVLASGRRIRWFRTAPILSPEQEELQTLRDLVAVSEASLIYFPDYIARYFFRAVADFPKLESMLEGARRDVGEWQHRIAELEGQAVTLPPILAADANERRQPIWADLCSQAKAAFEATDPPPLFAFNSGGDTKAG
jgi:hypothetical protein